MNEPTSLAFDTAGNLYVANAGSNLITKYTAAGVGTAFAAPGAEQPGGSGLRRGGQPLCSELRGQYHRDVYSHRQRPRTFASTGLNEPSGMAFDTAGNLYVANFGSNAIVKFTPGQEWKRRSSPPVCPAPPDWLSRRSRRSLTGKRTWAAARTT